MELVLPSAGQGIFSQNTAFFCQILCFYFSIGRSGRFLVKFCVYVEISIVPAYFLQMGRFLSNFACIEISGVGSHGPVTPVFGQKLCFFELSGVGPHWPVKAFGVEFSFFENSACAAHFCQMARLFVKICVF